ncbi:hypothetical protein [Lysobacter sp. CCNWLW3]
MAARAYQRIEPALRQIASEAMATGMSLDQDPRFQNCPDVGRQLSRDLQTGVLPVIVDLFFSGENRGRIEAILADSYTSAQLKLIASGGDPAGDTASTQKFNQALAGLQTEFQGQIMQDSRVVAEMTKAVQAAVLRSGECKAGS